jgi:hypothetical protein
MKTRSQIYDVEIDFDDASREWLKNKRKLRDATYEYKCMRQFMSGRYCSRTPKFGEEYCIAHNTNASDSD